LYAPGAIGTSASYPATTSLGRIAGEDVMDQSENAAEHIPNAEVIRVRNGTHLCVWTDPTSADMQERIAAA